jgi:hypothetical protein
MLADVASVAAVFERLAKGESLADMDIPQRIRDAVQAGQRAATDTLHAYFWL